MENQVINKVYYINLAHRTDRREEIETMLKKCSLYDISERIEAISDNPPILGCVKSHILALETFLKSGHSIGMIIEDDLVILDKNKLFQINIEFDLIQIAGNHLKLEDFDLNFKKVIDSQTTSGYIITKHFASILLENFKESRDLLIQKGWHHQYCLDIYWKKLQSISKWYTFYPVLGYQKESYSDIEKRVVNYKC